MFDLHLRHHKTLEYVVLNAGILERGDALAGKKDFRWEQTIETNLTAQIVGTRLAVLAMRASKSKGVIMFTASASSLFPMPLAPVYSASKAGLLFFANSITPRLIKHGIRVCCLCPQFTDTAMLQNSKKAAEDAKNSSSANSKCPRQTPEEAAFGDQTLNFLGSMKLLTVDQVVKGALFLLGDDTKVGTNLLLHNSGKAYEWKLNRWNMQQVPLDGRGKFQIPQSYHRKQLQQWAADIPETRKKVQVQRLSSDFRAATKVVSERIPELKPDELLIRRLYAGVNASDVNHTSGRYFGNPARAQKLLPFDAGFEAVGVVAKTGSSVKGFKPGSMVAEMTFGGFCQWGTAKAKLVLPVPSVAPEIIGLLTCGLTASIGLELAGQMVSGETVLVTAAAGGTGQLVVQLAKLAGNHVIATCGGADKAELLKKIGADRVINYRTENVKDVLKKEYPKGVNLIWESVGGEMFETCVRALAIKGRIIVIGMMSQYSSGWKPSVSKGLLEFLLTKSASVRGFFLTQHTRHYKKHITDLAQKWMSGQLYVAIDNSKFIGEESCVDAVEHLQTGKSVGKVVVQLPQLVPQAGQSSRL